MTRTLTPYPAYKDTGIEWLGQIPSHWEVRLLKRVAQINPSKSEVSNPMRDGHAVFLPMERVGADGQYDTSEIRPISELWNGFTYFRRGDIIIAKITPCFENGKGAWLENLPTEIGFGSTEFHVIRPHKEITAPYLYRITTLSEFRRLGTDAMTGAAGQQRVPAEFVANFSIPLPPLAEQAAIVRYLDFVDGRMRRYARAQQQTIRLLTEYKQSLIHHAVTGKVNVCTGAPYTTYHDTGIEWLGQVPSHWEVCRLKSRLVKNESGIWNDRHNTHGTIVLRSTEQTISGGWRIENPARLVLSPEERETYLLQVGDLLVTKSSGSPDHIGKTSLVTEEIASLACAFSNFMQRLRVDKDTHPKLIWYYLNSPVGREQLIFQSTTTTGLGNLNGKMLGNCIIAIPPLAEQGAIVEYLDAQTARIDAAIAAVQRRLALVGEYRERLVADVVTGKVDVRAVAAGLPSDADAPTDTETYGEAYHVGDAVP